MALILRPILPDKHAGRVGADLHIARAFSFFQAGGADPRDPADGNLKPTVKGELLWDEARKELWLANGLTIADWILLRSPAEVFKASDAFSTTSGTFVLVTSGTGDDLTFTVPFDGDYFAIFSASGRNGSNSTELEVALFANGVQDVTTSRRHQGLADGGFSFGTVAFTALKGQVIDVRMRRSAGGSTSTVNERDFFVRRIA